MDLLFFTSNFIVANSSDNDLCTVSSNDDVGGGDGDCPGMYTISHVMPVP